MNSLELLLVASLVMNAFFLLAVVMLSFLLKNKAQELQLSGSECERIRSEKAYFEGQISELALIKERLAEKELLVSSLYIKENQFIEELTRIKTRQQHDLQSQQEKLQLLKESKQQLLAEFEALANNLLDKKTAQIKEQQDSFLDQTMRPLKDQLLEFRQRIDKVHENDSKDRVQLITEISHLKTLNQQMSKETVSLTNALRGNQKFQGNWGEFVLEKVLEDSGLRKGYEFELQSRHYDESGNRRLPDVIVHLPDNKDLIIDAKVSLVDYQRYCESDSADSREQFLKSHLRSMEQHIKNLSIKDYELLAGVNSLDFVLLFVPVEAAFLLALESCPALFQQAYDKHIILVSPTTLLATLRTVENLWRFERQNKNAEEIATQAGNLYDQCVLFVESLEEVGRCLARSTDAYEKSMSRLTSGRGNIITRIGKLKTLGAKTKRQLPGHISGALEDVDMSADNEGVE